jgi:hypothetical protein
MPNKLKEAYSNGKRLRATPPEVEPFGKHNHFVFVDGELLYRALRKHDKGESTLVQGIPYRALQAANGQSASNGN